MSQVSATNDEPLLSSGLLRDNLNVAAITCDASGRITSCTPAAGALLGRKSEELCGRTLAELPSAMKKVAAEALAGTKPVVDHQLNLAEASGESLPVRVQAVAVTGADGQCGGVVLLLSDLSRLRKLEHNIRRLDRLANIGTLSASLAHEIKNSLVAVKTFVDLLLEKNQDAELAEVVGREMKRVDSLVTQMLRVANPARTSTKPVGVHELLDHSLRLLQHQISEKLIVVRRQYAAPAEVVNGNGYQLEQAFMNLLLNALEAMSPHGELTVATEVLPAGGATPAYLQLTFKDTGIGISPETKARLFETFFTTKQNGTGLGLSITRRIIREHHGEISVASEPGQGAVFKVTLPLISPGK